MVYANYFKKMKIAIWHECYIQGGSDWSMIDLVSSWPNKKDKFYIFINESHTGINLIKKKLSFCNINLYRSISEDYKFTQISNNKLLDKFFKFFYVLKIIIHKLYEYRQLINLYKYDVLIYNNGGYPGGLSGFVAASLSRFKRKKNYMIVRNYINKNFKDDYLLLFLKYLSNLVFYKVITVSKSLNYNLIKNTGIKKNKFVMIPNGVSISNKAPNNFDILFKGNHKKIGIIGSLEKRKGHEILIYAIKDLLKRKKIDLKVYIIGPSDSDNLKRVINLIDKFKLKKYFIFHKFSENIGDIIKQIDIVVMPSQKNESFGRVAAECMGYMTPIIASNTGGLKEIITDNYDGMLFPKEDYKKLSYKIETLILDDKFKKTIINNAKTKFKQNYDSKIMSLNYSNLIKI